MSLESGEGYKQPGAKEWKAPETEGGSKEDSSAEEVGLIEKNRAEQERVDHFKLSENCGVAAYAELTGNVPKEKLERHPKIGNTNFLPIKRKTTRHG